MAAPPRDIVQRLYATPPDRFVAARDEAVAAARAAGDPTGARSIARLRKPTVAAWLVNLLAIQRPDLITGLVELSAALRTAQRDLRGAQLRELSGQRRSLVGALVAEARALAARTPGAPSGKLPLAEVEATLQAALADLEVAEQVRSGRLVRPVTYAGFGEVPRPRLRLVTADETADHVPAGGTAPGRPDREQPGPTGESPQGRQAEEESTGARRTARAGAEERAERARRRRALRRELDGARTAQRRAERELARASAAEQEGAAALAGLEAEIAKLERRRAAAEQEHDRRRLARRAAERGVVAARRQVGEVEAVLEAEDDDGTAESSSPR